METIFLEIVNMSVAASWLIMAVILLRMILKKAPKIINYLLWALVGFRLICPYTIESVLSLIPSAETVPADIMYTQTPILLNEISPKIEGSINPMQIISEVSSYIWIIGTLGMMLYMIISYILLRNKVRASIKAKDNIYYCDSISTPFILGFIRPRIYLHSDIDETHIPYILMHEKEHLKYFDYIWKTVGFIILSIHWFNPLVWVSYNLMCKDMELACDERVVKNMQAEEKKKYSMVLLACSVNNHKYSACPVAFGEVGIKQRIKYVLKSKKPSFWMICFAILMTLILCVCFLTNPKKHFKSEEEASISDDKKEIGFHFSDYAWEYTPKIVNIYKANDPNETVINGWHIYNTYYEMDDGTWQCGGYSYRFCFEVTGKAPNTTQNISYLVLSNTKYLTFQQVFKASGISSNLNDYFKPEVANIVAAKFQE